MRSFLWLTCVAVGATGWWITIVAAQDVVKKEPDLDSLISPNAKVERVQDGFGFAEGPVWVQKGRNGYLLFSDIAANVIFKLTADGKASVYMEKSGYSKPDIWRVGFEFNNGKEANDAAFAKFYMNGSNGLALDPQGRLIIASFAGRSIDRIEQNGKRTVLADSYDGKRLNGTNDVVVKKDGAIYFTDMFGSLRNGDKDPAIGLPYQAVYMVTNGKVTRLTEDLPQTNGLAFAPDEKVFYANGSRNKYIRRYDVKADGTLANSRMLIDLNSDTTPGITDGMKVDTIGNIWTTGPGGVWVISPEGKLLGTIRTPETLTNLAFGDADKKTLYMTARPTIYRIRVNVKGI
jgi:gluconolactonase